MTRPTAPFYTPTVEGLLCSGGTCQAPSCSDGVKNGNETDVDCGGSCPACPMGDTCGVDTDCQSAVCSAGTCAAPSCIDGVQNEGETGVDCGGPCPSCSAGMGCHGPADCTSGVCTGGTCAAPTCSDGVQNQGETAIDCGGPNCAPCGVGLTCVKGGDCTSGVCTGGTCKAPTCMDGVKNGTETDVDCGGTCPACSLTKDCKVTGDCQSGTCFYGRCAYSTFGMQGAHQYTVGNGPYATTIADFDGDGIPDVAEVDIDGGDVSTLFGNGDGTFRPGATYSTGFIPEHVVAGDLNGDGRPELVVSNTGTNAPPEPGSVAVLLNHGDGTFAAATQYLQNGDIADVALGDFDHDGHLDIVVGNYGTASLDVLPNNGDGTFGAPIVTPIGVSGGPAHMNVVDVNDDGWPDVVSVVSLDSGQTMFGAAGGTFTAGPTFEPFGSSYTGMRVADLNGDGILDVVVCDDSGLIGVSLGTGGGNFELADWAPIGLDLRALDVADFDGDGVADVVFSGYAMEGDPGLNYVDVLKYETAMTYQTLGTYVAALNPNGLHVADLDGNGTPDIVVATNGHLIDETTSIGGGVGVYLSMGAAGFIDAPVYAADVYPWAIAVGDINGDGKADMAAVNHDSNDVSVLLQGNGGTFGAATNYSVGTEPSGVVAADFDGNGTIDLATSDGSNDVSVLLNTGGGKLAAAVQYALSAPCETLAVGDLNHDGHPDLVTASGGIAMLFKGNGTFDAPGSSTDGSCLNPRAVSLADVNGDGWLDGLLACAGDPTTGMGGGVIYLPNVGGGLAWGHPLLTAGLAPCSVAGADFDGNGTVDIAAANNMTNDVSVFLGDGKGNFSPATSYPVGVSPFWVVATDLNGDGRGDIASANWQSSSVSVLLGTPTGFRTIPFIAGDQPAGLAYGDINGDGKVDLAAASWWDVSPLLNRSH